MDLSDIQVWASLLTLTALEIVLGIDNIIFLTIIVAKLPPEMRQLARKVGLFLALVMRILLLATISWMTKLTAPIIEIVGYSLSWRDIILLSGGLFLLAKATLEIHHQVEGADDVKPEVAKASFAMVIFQIALLDLVFSLDSVITAVGMSEHLPVMITAVVIAIVIMLFCSQAVGDFVLEHPTAKMLGLSFLLLVGVSLVADGFHFHIPRGYLYFAISFSAFVEAMNIISSKKSKAARAA